MYKENVPSTCYEKLLDAVGKGTEPLHKYIALRKKVLGVDTLNMYDLYVSMVKEQELALEYEDAVKLVKEALKVMGKEYSDVLASAFESGWIDAFENKGKRSGAYSWGVYGVHPFVLLNYQKPFTTCLPLRTNSDIPCTPITATPRFRKRKRITKFSLRKSHRLSTKCCS